MTGKNAKKKLHRQVEKQVDQAAYFSLAGSPKRKESLKQELVHQIAALRLANWREDLQRASRLLGVPGCWQLYQQYRNEALALGVEPDLHALVVQAAKQFSGHPVNTLASG